jgi:Transposase IS66 family
MAESSPDISGLGLDELKALLVQALEEVARLKKENAGLREEIARLKGLKGRPKLKPSGMEKAVEAASAKGSGKRKGRRGAKRSKLTVSETRIVKPDSLPEGSRFKGYEDFIVQDLVITPWTIRYRRERWLLPSGETVVASLPKEAASHFGPNLKRFVLSQYHQGQVTVPRLNALLADLGLDISKRQIVRLLSAKQDIFLAEAIEVLRAGLASARWITVDDTSARHKARNGFCTHIGNDRFAFFATTGSKSRINFLELPRAGSGGYVINEAALACMREHKLPHATIARFGSAKRRFSGRKAFMAYLKRIGLTELKVNPDPVQIATEGALWGTIAEQGLLDRTVIVSDGAGQFRIGEHALCWVHAERLIHKLDTFCEVHIQAKERIRRRVWRLYKALKAYRRAPTQRCAARLAHRFDAIFPRVKPEGMLHGDGLCHARQAAGKAPRPKRRPARGAEAPGNPAPHQRLGKRYPLPGHAPEDLRRHSLGRRPRRSRRFSRDHENLRQAGRQLLGLPWRSPWSTRCSAHRPSGRTHPRARRSVTAQRFAPITPGAP